MSFFFIYNSNESETIYSDEKIIDNCKKFLSNRIIKLFPEKKKNKTTNQKFMNLSSLNLSSRSSFKTTVNKNSIFIHKIKNKSAFIPKQLDKKNYHIKSNNSDYVNLRVISSAKNIRNMNNKNINNYITQTKVNEIIKNLLLKNKVKKLKKSYSNKLYPLKKCVDKNKNIESNIRKDPSNEKIFKSLKIQMKIISDENRRRLLKEGVNDYHINIKKYKDIFFDTFSCFKKDQKIVNERKNNSSNNFHKKSNNIYIKPRYKITNDLNKFQYDYLKAYNEWKFNYGSKNRDKYINNNSYSKYLSKREFDGVMSIDSKMDILDKSLKSNINKMKKKFFRQFK